MTRPRTIIGLVVELPGEVTIAAVASADCSICAPEPDVGLPDAWVEVEDVIVLAVNRPDEIGVDVTSALSDADLRKVEASLAEQAFDDAREERLEALDRRHEDHLDALSYAMTAGLPGVKR